MKTLIATISAMVVVGCATTKQLEPPTDKAPDISIHDAVEKGNIEAVKYHLTAGTKVDLRDDGVTLLQMTAGEGQKEIAELLIAKGADVNAMTPDGLTALFAAILGPHKEMAELLIEAGVNIDESNNGSQTPLHKAAFEGRDEIVNMLIQNGANVNPAVQSSGSFNGMTPLDFALTKGKSSTADLLRKHGGKTGDELKVEGK